MPFVHDSNMVEADQLARHVIVDAEEAATAIGEAATAIVEVTSAVDMGAMWEWSSSELYD